MTPLKNAMLAAIAIASCTGNILAEGTLAVATLEIDAMTDKPGSTKVFIDRNMRAV